MSSSRVFLLGVSIDAVTRTGALEMIRGFLREEKQRHIMTPNNEMLMETAHNADFRALLNETDLNIPDSTGLVWMARLTGQRLPERVTGVDTVTALCASLTKEAPVFLLGAQPGIAEAAASVLLKNNPRLKIVGCFAGSPREEDAPTILAMIRAAAPHLLLVAFGAPAQDLWIAKHLQEMPSVRVAVGVGGTFDFLAGKRQRAPIRMQRLGLEWLWRLMREPRRIGRIWRAVVIFPLLVLRFGKSAPRQ
ncbi:MAG: WecB/TagA/CpsF family glycosyltransferase [Candidatus Peribacteraceae bacterium]|nr:WecB/TagA/CpsF family glycosyltransferase [Candidatus Peribacteraceae bacterium]MDD5742253.1 WecB/TagA/CpsF family glycosyltransferase [Candidatus Peribacteraceae bacterium]